MSRKFANLPIASKLTLSFGILIAGIIGASMFGMSRIQSGLATVFQSRVVPIVGLRKVADSYAVNIVDTSHKTRNGSLSFEEASKNIEEADRTIEKEWKAYTSSLSDPREKALAAETAQVIAVADKQVEVLKVIMRNRDKARLSQVCSNTLYPAIDPVSDKVSKLIEFQLNDAKSLYLSSRSTASMLMLIIPIVSILAGAIVVRFITRSVTIPIKALSTRLTSIETNCVSELVTGLQAMERGDLTVKANATTTPIESPSEDEVGRMCTTFNSMLNKLHQTISAYEQTRASLTQMVMSVRESAASVAASSSELTEIAQVSGTTAAEIAHSISEVALAADQSANTSQEMAKGSEQQAQSATGATAQMERLGQTIHLVREGGEKASHAAETADEQMKQAAAAVEQVAATSRKMADVAAEASTAAKVGGTAVSQTIESMQRIQNQVTASADKVRELDQKSQEIGAIVETIDQIAGQTNLLALNAAIEAARAGEHGKGFAVVADEVRKLAERSAGATKEIGALIESVRLVINEAVHTMQMSNDEVNDGAGRSREAGIALEQILSAADRVAQEVESLGSITVAISDSVSSVRSTVRTVREVTDEQRQAMLEMAAGSAQVSDDITSVASISQQTAAGAQEMSASAEEVSASAQTVSAAVEQQTASIRKISEAASGLSSMSVQLKELVDRFVTESGRQQYAENSVQLRSYDMRRAA
jgi:methyl-accepting chemotaxis protein